MEVEHTTVRRNDDHSNQSERAGFSWGGGQKQKRKSVKEEVVVRGQVLLDATNDQLKTINNYLRAFATGADPNYVSELNQNAMTGLKLYRGNCKVLRKKE